MSWKDFIKIPWNKYEAALLVFVYQEYASGNISRAAAVSQLSNRLRARMRRIGIPISDAFRNEAGIALQMSAIEFIFTDGKSGTSHSSVLFREICQEYLTHREAFDELLRVANQKYPLVAESENGSGEQNSFEEGHQLGTTTEQIQLSNLSLQERVTRILIDRFPKGFRLKSHIEASRFRRIYFDHFQEELHVQDLDDLICRCGIEHEGRLYVPEVILPEKERELLFEYIDNEIDLGHCIYYQSLFNRFESLFQEGAIFDTGILKAFIQFYKPEFVFHKSFFTTASGPTASLESIVSQCYLEAGKPLTDSEVHNTLYFLPQDTISNAISRVPQILSSGRGQKFHIGIVHFPQDVLDDISALIAREILAKQYISEKELLDVLKVKFPEYFSDSILPDVGIRNALAFIFHAKFNFDGKIISSYDKPFDMSEVFRDFSKDRDSFSLEELQTLANDLGTQIYFDAVFENSVRINHDVFVAKHTPVFQIELTDTLLNKLCIKDYLPIKSVSSYGVFPEASSPWNNYLLESYVGFFSKQYKLVHAYFTANFTYGAIVKRTSTISSFDDLITRALADSDCPLNKHDVLAFLASMGYIVKRTYNNIDQVIQNARTIRNQRLSIKG